MNSRFRRSKSWYLIGLLAVLALPAWAMVGRSVAPGGWSAKGGTESGRGLEQRAAAPAYAGVSPRGPSVGWDALTESGGAYEDERESGRIIPWEPDDDVDAMGGLRGDGDIAVYDNAPCGGNGIVDLDDIFGVLDAFAGIIPCTCPAAGGGWALTGNGGTNEATDFLGTTDNVALNVRVNNLRAFRLEPNAISPNVIGGFSGNSVTAGAFGATIGGGGASGYVNTVTGNFATVGGGIFNTASGYDATVGGGENNMATGVFSTVGGGFINTASGDGATVGGGAYNTASDESSTVGGGAFNTASGYRSTVGGGAYNTASDESSTVGGGQSNIASGDWSTVGGGYANTASGVASTVAGGYFNTAGGHYSFAAGLGAKVRDDDPVSPYYSGDSDGDEGTFVWADDSIFVDFISSGPNQFLIRAAGGVGINRNNPAHPLHIGTDTSNGNGAHVTAGGVWTSTSDRNTKQNFERLDSQAVLQAVADLPMSKWQYIGERDDVRHIGPMAQDFYSAFGLGQSDKHIGMIDADGVALAAIQGLHGVLQEKDCQIEELGSQISNLKFEIAELKNAEARLARLEALLQDTLTKEENP